MLRHRSRIRYSIVTGSPAVEPISLSDAKSFWLKEDLTTNDSTIPILIQAAREMVEEFTQRSLITQTRQIKLDCFPVHFIDLMYAPVQSVAITYYDDSDSITTLPTADYYVDLSSHIPRLMPADAWPGSYDRLNAVTVEYVAGYGDASTDVPAALIQATGVILRRLYNEPDQSGLPDLAISLMNPYVVTQDATY